MILQWEEFCVNSRTKAAHFLELLCFFPFFFFFFIFIFIFIFIFLFLERKEGCAARFVSFFLETRQKVLGSVDCFLANSLFLSFTRFLWTRTNCFWSSNNLFFCSTEILDVLVGNKFSSFCLSRKLKGSNR